MAKGAIKKPIIPKITILIVITQATLKIFFDFLPILLILFYTLMLSKKTKKRKNFQDSPLFSVFLYAAIFGVIALLVVSNFRIQNKRTDLTEKVNELRQEVYRLENKQEKLKININQSDSEEYLEEIAREKFNLQKEGETVVVVKKEESETGKDNETEERGLWRKFLEKLPF